VIEGYLQKRNDVCTDLIESGIQHLLLVDDEARTTCTGEAAWYKRVSRCRPGAPSVSCFTSDSSATAAATVQ